MKYIIVIAALATAVMCGCTSQKIQVLENTNVVTNQVPLKSFGGETYIWESWTHSTNEVKGVVK